MSASTFSAFWAVMRKELRDVARDRRTLVMALLLGPLMYPAIMLGMGTLAEKRARTQLDSTLKVPVIGAEHAPNLIGFLASKGIRATTPPKDVDAAIIAQDIDVALAIAPDFAEDWHEGRPAKVELILDTTRRDAEIPSERLRAALSAYGQQMGALRLLARGVSPAVTQPLNIAQRDLASEQAQRGRLLSFMLPYLLIITSFLGGAALILDATAGERERQSLEPLLATPARRGAVVSGKIAAACALGLLSLLLTLLAFKLSAQLSSGVGRLMDVSFLAMAKMLVILLPMLFIGTALLTYLAAGSKSMKEAQSHMVWLMLLPMLPTFVLMVNPVKAQLWQFVVPFLAQNQLLLKVIRGEAIAADVWTTYLAAGFGLALVLWFGAVRRYHQERLAISA